MATYLRRSKHVVLVTGVKYYTGPFVLLTRSVEGAIMHHLPFMPTTTTTTSSSSLPTLCHYSIQGQMDNILNCLQYMTITGPDRKKSIIDLILSAQDEAPWQQHQHQQQQQQPQPQMMPPVPMPDMGSRGAFVTQHLGPWARNDQPFTTTVPPPPHHFGGDIMANQKDHFEAARAITNLAYLTDKRHSPSTGPSTTSLLPPPFLLPGGASPFANPW